MRSAARALQRAGVPALGAASKRRVPAIRTRVACALRAGANANAAGAGF